MLADDIGMRNTLTVRVTYAETDQMGMVYYGNYLAWFERGRTELLRAAGLAYKRVEEQGIHLPVLEAQCRYRKSARYDDLLTVQTWVPDAGGATVRFEYEIYRGDELLANGYTVHAFVAADGRPVRPPRFVADIIRSINERSAHP